MWTTVMKWAVKVALYAASHPNDVKVAVDTITRKK